jgi:hypothetical protein
VWRLNALHWNAETSMLKTLGAKHKSTVAKMAARYKAKIQTPLEHPGFHAHLVLCDAASPGGLCCDEVTGLGARA